MNKALEKGRAPLSISSLGSITYNAYVSNVKSNLELCDQYWSWNNNQISFSTLPVTSNKKAWVKIPQIAGIPLLDLFPVVQSDDAWFNFSILENQEPSKLLDRVSLNSPSSSHVYPDKKVLDQLFMYEQCIHERRWDSIAYHEDILDKVCGHSPRFVFDKAVKHYACGDYQTAKNCFYKAQQLGHPLTDDGIKASHHLVKNLVVSKHSWYRLESLYPDLDSLRKILPETEQVILFELLSGDSFQKEDYQTACLLASEGLRLGLVNNPLLEILWSSLTQLSRDEQALHTARLALQVAPGNAQHYINAFDSATLLGRHGLARVFLSAFLCQANKVPQKIERCLTYFEQVNDWHTMNSVSKRLLAMRNDLSPKSQAILAEGFLETGQSNFGMSLLELTLSRNPDNIEAVLAYGRGLARSGDYPQAEKFISAYLKQSRSSCAHDNLELVLALHSEILRALGRVEEALEVWDSKELSTPRALLEHAACLVEQTDYNNAKQLLAKSKSEVGSEPTLERILEKIEAAMPGNTQTSRLALVTS